MTLREHSLKNIYIGEYKTRHYDYTFKWKTATEIWNEWTKQIGDFSVNSDWVTGTSSQEMRITKSIPSLATAKRIVIQTTVVWINSVYTAWAVWIWNWAWWGTYVANFNIYGSQYNWIRLELYDWASNYWNTIWTATAATYDATLTIDLENKTMTGSIPWFSDSVLTLTDAWISMIRAYEYIVCYASLNRSTISDVSIDIIY